MNPPNKNKILILVASGILITTGILFLLTRTEYENVSDSQKSYQDKLTTLNSQEKKLASLQKMDQDSAEVKQIQTYMEGLLPNDLNGSAFVASLEKLGNRLQVTPLSVSVNSNAAGSKDKNLPSSYSFSVTFNTSFQNLTTFLAEMEKLERFNTITNISMSPNDKGLGINLSGNIYQYKSVK